MGRYDVLVVLVGVALLLRTGQCIDSCQAQDGRPGEAGGAGRDGWPGQKGEKGEPAPSATGPPDASVLPRLRGDMGSRGLQGAMGPKGYRGDLGPAGVPGRPGPPGADGRRFSSNAESFEEAQSAFSVRTNTTRHPGYKTVTFDVSLLMKPSPDFDLATGHFTCRVSGVYYFVFHSMSKVSMCLQLVSDALGEEKLGFCDYNTRSRPQVLSGGVVLQLTAGQKVWLESFKDRQPDSVTRDVQEKMILFNGFLIF